MPTIAEEFPQVFALPRERRAELIEALQESLESELDEDGLPPLPPAFIDELRRRRAEHEADPSTAIPWEVVKARLIARGKQ